MRRDNRDMRPPRTYHDLNRFSPTDGRNRNELQMVRPIHNYAGSRNAPFEFSRMNDREHDRTRTQTTQVNDFRQERMNIESPRRQDSIQTPQDVPTPPLQQTPTLPDTTRDRSRYDRLSSSKRQLSQAAFPKHLHLIATSQRSPQERSPSEGSISKIELFRNEKKFQNHPSPTKVQEASLADPSIKTRKRKRFPTL